MRSALVLLAVVTGCGAPAAGPGAGAPATEAASSLDARADEEASPGDDDGPQDLADVDAAARAFEAAERALAAVDPALVDPALVDAEAGEALEAREEEAEPAQVDAGGAAQRPPGVAPAPGRATPLADDRCPHACRALDSMRRSAARLCELTGPDDPRCQHVEERLGRARDAVSRTCPRCM